MWPGRPRPCRPMDNGRGRPFYNGGLSPEHRLADGKNDGYPAHKRLTNRNKTIAEQKSPMFEDDDEDDFLN